MSLNLDAQVLVGGIDRTEYLSSIRRDSSLCEGTHQAELVFEPSFPHASVSPWNTVVLYEGGSKVMTGYVDEVDALREPRKSVVIRAQDNYLRAHRFFLTEEVSTSGSATLGYWVGWLMEQAGLSYSIDDATTSATQVSEEIPFGLRTVHDALTEFLAMARWYHYTDADGVVHFGKLSDLSGDPVALSDIEQVEKDRSDRFTRNVAKVYGVAEYTEGRVFAKDSVVIPGIVPDRTIVAGSGLIVGQAAAQSLATELVRTLGFIRDIYQCEVQGAPAYRLALLASFTDNFLGAGSGYITSLKSSLDEEGYVANATLGETCPRLGNTGGILALEGYIYVATSDRLAHCSNMLVDSPSWVNITGLVTGTINDFILDPWEPLDKAWVVTSTGVWKTSSLNTVAPVWSQVLTLAAIQSQTGASSIADVSRVHASIDYQNRFFIIVVGNDGVSTQARWLGHTHDNGTTWTWIPITPTQSNETRDAFDVSDHGSQRLFYGGHTSGGATPGNCIWRSTDGGHSMPLYNRIYSGTSERLLDIRIPYENNASDLIQYMVIHTSKVLKTTDGWSTSVGITPPGFGAPPEAPYLCEVYTYDNDRVYVSDGLRLFLSTDGGTSWVQLSTFALSRAFGGFPYNNQRVYRLSALNHTPADAPPWDNTGVIFTSPDGGLTWQDKTGNWATAVSSSFNTGKMIVPVFKV